MEDVGTQGGVTFGLAVAINEAGQIAGTKTIAVDDYGVPYAGGYADVYAGGIRWSASGVKLDLPIYAAFAINGTGAVAGTDGFAAVVWTSEGGAKPVPGGPFLSSSEATGINDRGSVTGTIYDMKARRGFLYTISDGFQEIPPPVPAVVAQ